MAKIKKPVRTLTDILRGLLPAPIREEPVLGGVLLTAGDPGMVTVQVLKEGVIVSVFGVCWDGPHTASRADRELCRLSWNELPAELPEQAVVVQALVQAAVIVRRAKFRGCRFCQKMTPPEWQHGEDVCQGCAERHLGVVH